VTNEALARKLDRRAFLRGALAAGAGSAALYAIGCSSGSGGSKSPTPAQTSTAVSAQQTADAGANPAGLKPSLLTTEFVAGQDNRFVVGLLNAQNQLVKDAGVHMRFFTLAEDGVTGTFRGEGDGTYIELNVPGAHEHDKSVGDAASDDTVSFYVANTPFDVAGQWGVEITATPNNGSTPSQVRAPFTVLSVSQSPALGSMPPASKNDTSATNPDASSLCSRLPACPLHDTVIADVLGKGRPLVVQFSTPAFCQTRFCGPVLEVLLQQAPAYRDAIDFVHIEVWQDFQLQKYRPAVQEWDLPGEPYTFFMDPSGKVVGKLEAIFSQDELKSALDKLAQT
jgi:hypothetical protein